MESTAWLDGLLSETGQRLLACLSTEDLSPQRLHGLSERLSREYPPEMVAAALTQTELRARARTKFERADQMYFTRDGLEQASSERMARNHARRYEGLTSIADLCTGIGGDLLALAADRSVLAVDVDSAQLRLARLNAEVYAVGDRVSIRCADVRDVSLSEVDGVFIDPARRAGGRRLLAGKSEPPLTWCFSLAEQASAVGIKAAPGLPLDLVPPGWEAEFVAEGADLKEAVLWSPTLATTLRRATLLPVGEALLPLEGDPVPIASPGMYLIDPNPAVTRAGLVEDLGRALRAWKIDRQVGFLSSDVPADSPFGRTLRVEDSRRWNLKDLRRELRSRGIGVVDVRKRGSAVDVDDLRRRLRLRGDRAATVVLTRVLDRPWMLICTSLEERTSGAG